MKSLLIQYIFKRLLEGSTLKGIIVFIGTLIGYHFSDSQTDNLIYIILGLAGLLGTFLPDNFGKVIQESIENSKLKLLEKQDNDTSKIDDQPQQEATQQGFGDK